MKRKVQYLPAACLFLMVLSLPQQALAASCSRYEPSAYPHTLILLDWFQGGFGAYLTGVVWLMSVAGLSGLLDHLPGSRKFGIGALLAVIWIEILGRVLGRVVRCDDAPVAVFNGDLFAAVFSGTILFAIPGVLLGILVSWGLIQSNAYFGKEALGHDEAPEMLRLHLRRMTGGATTVMSIALALFAVEVHWGMTLTATVIALGSWYASRQQLFQRDAFEALSALWIPVIAYGCATAMVNVFMFAPHVL